MRVPRHWARAKGHATRPDGKRQEFSTWGWSASSPNEAVERARQRVASIIEKAGSGEDLDRYPYGTNPRREEIIRELGTPDSPSHAFISRNRYGALVLNTAQVPFIDVDVEEAPKPSILSRLLARFRNEAEDEPSEPPTLRRIRETARRSASRGFRIYRTAAGYRVLVTNVLLDPAGSEAQEMLRAFESDARFAALCRVQSSFRARLHPKPWRVGLGLPPSDFPRENPRSHEAFARWLERYDRAIADYATCRLVETVGPREILDEAREIVETHDGLSRASVDLPLA